MHRALHGSASSRGFCNFLLLGLPFLLGYPVNFYKLLLALLNILGQKSLHSGILLTDLGVRIERSLIISAPLVRISLFQKDFTGRLHFILRKSGSTDENSRKKHQYLLHILQFRQRVRTLLITLRSSESLSSRALSIQTRASSILLR